ncbi:unnamed protein product [Arabis nemorensis]|uniref:Uncharacterized protein n=1 Tax=Arabis nemorensis TaxID=586526 RepID=A0A565CPA3_9BRAS|nr:unnamed protein product [Arabis nemorensis]
MKILNQNSISSFSASPSGGLSLMEAQTMAHIHKARISREDEAESSSVEDPRSDQNPVETGTSKAAGSSKLGASFPRGLGVAVRDLIAALFGPLAKRILILLVVDFDSEQTESSGARPRSSHKVCSF